jgi:malate dehydrogenase
MNISVVGASGDIGREIVTKLVEMRTMDHGSTLQLVGRPEGPSASFLFGLMSDIRDAHAEICPRLEIVLDPEAVRGDLVIFCAGQTIPTDPHNAKDRASLAAANAPVFQAYAEAIARNGHHEQIIIVVSNPVELAVHIFAKHIDPRRVIGMGSFLDTIRFRREIAEDLGVRRQRVRGLVVGQHGPGMVPLWSTVGVYGFDNEAGRAKLNEIRQRNRMAPAEAMTLVKDLILANKAGEALDKIQRLPPDLRVLVEPFLTHLSGAKTRVGTSEIVLRLVETISMGTEVVTACQAKIDGEFLGVHSVIGVPILLSHQGITEILPLDVTNEEAAEFRRSAEQINQFLSPF